MLYSENAVAYRCYKVQNWLKVFLVAIAFGFSAQNCLGQIQPPNCQKILSLTDRSYRNLADINTFKIMTLNVENMFEELNPLELKAQQKFQTEYLGAPRQKVHSKPANELRHLAATIRRADPDILTLQEVENYSTLRKFSENYLGGIYEPLLIQGNDLRGINIGFLIKRDLPIHFKAQSHKFDVWQDPILQREARLFSRDLPVVKFYRGVETAPSEQSPFMVIIGNHAKSLRNRKNEDPAHPLEDPRSSMWRTAQNQAIEKIARDLEMIYPMTPIFLAGDFNTSIAIGNRELNPLWNVFQDSFNAIPGSLSFEQRITHSYHPTKTAGHYSQMDAIMVNNAAKPYLKEVVIVNYLDQNGNEMPLPWTIDERKLQPSDHRGVLLTLAPNTKFFRQNQN